MTGEKHPFPRHSSTQIATFYLLLFTFYFLTACTAPPTADAPTPAVVETATPSPVPTAWPEEVMVTAESAAVLISGEGISGRLHGTLPSPCYTPAEPQMSRQGSTFSLRWQARQSAETPCLPQSQPITADFTLPHADLPDGFYTVRVNDSQAQTSFTFQAAMLAEGAGSAFVMQLRGWVWHDACAVRPGETADTLPTGCQIQANGQARANGVREPNEQGLEHVLVNLGVGACPVPAVLQTVTDQDGRFTFDSLANGTYCVFVEADSGSNQLLLAPGQWTTEAAVTVRTGTDSLALGWDYDLLPRPVSAEVCEDKGLFVADVSYGDGAAVAAGSTITKTWRVENVGTCTWTTDYKLVPVALGVEEVDVQPLPRPIVPGAIAELSATITVPTRTGTYTAEWLIQNERGQSFGLGIAVPRPLTLVVVVE